MNTILKWVTIFAAFVCVHPAWAQDRQSIATNTLLDIVRAEDELRFDRTLRALLEHKDPDVRARAALAGGRIGADSAVPALAELLLTDRPEVARMAAFAIGEIESESGAEPILRSLRGKTVAEVVRARSVEAAGKIAAANAETAAAGKLSAAILDVLEAEFRRGTDQDRLTVLLGITAVIRAKPVDGDYVVSKFLTNMDGRIRADAANAIARLGSKRYGKQLQALVLTDDVAIARANAARALGVAEDKSAINLLLEAAITDSDQRVRVNSLGALARIAEKASGSRVLQRAEALCELYHKGDSKPELLNELLVISTALGRIMEGSSDVRTVRFLHKVRKATGYRAPETEVALVRVSPVEYGSQIFGQGSDWRVSRAVAAGFGAAAELSGSKSAEQLKTHAEKELRRRLSSVLTGSEPPDLSFPAVLSAFAAFKSNDLAEVLRKSLRLEDVVIRETAASLLGESDIPEDPKLILTNYKALADAFDRSGSDKLNDAALSALGAMVKQILKLRKKDIETGELEAPVKSAIRSSDYLVRRRGRSLASELGIDLENASDSVRFEAPGNSRLKRHDYKRAVNRKAARAVLTTSKGKFSIDFFPQAAPLTVENFVYLARSGYYNGLEIHRVVPNFVVQDGDPRGDGSGGPGWHIRCEINQIPYERGTVGMALSGKDTGGSQWFVAHSPQPHLDGGYTVFGKVNEEGMSVVDMLSRGDVIERVEIVE